jgi:uncharacterized protein YjbJ (UPF0337 family)
MFNQQTIQGNWNEIKGKLLNKWGELTDDDLTAFNGNVQQLVGTIQRKTGEARETIEQFFEQLSSGSAAAIHRAGDSVRTGAQQAAETIEETYERSAESLRKGYADVEDVVRQRPGKSLLVSFGVGVVTGALVALLLRRR